MGKWDKKTRRQEDKVARKQIDKEDEIVALFAPQLLISTHKTDSLFRYHVIFGKISRNIWRNIT